MICFTKDSASSLKVLERRRDEELFDEELRVEDGDVGGAADERVRVGGQRVVHVVPHQGRRGVERIVALLGKHQRAQDVGHHLAVGAPCEGGKRSRNHSVVGPDKGLLLALSHILGIDF